MTSRRESNDQDRLKRDTTGIVTTRHDPTDSHVSWAAKSNIKPRGVHINSEDQIRAYEEIDQGESDAVWEGREWVRGERRERDEERERAERREKGDGEGEGVGKRERRGEEMQRVGVWGCRDKRWEWEGVILPVAMYQYSSWPGKARVEGGVGEDVLAKGVTKWAKRGWK